MIVSRPGNPPSVRELCEATKTYPNNINQHLVALRRAGLVTWEYGLARTLVARVQIEAR